MLIFLLVSGGFVMKLSAEMLLESIQKEHDVTLNGKYSKKQNLQFPSFFEKGISEIKSGDIFIADINELPERMPSFNDFLFVCCGNRIPEAYSDCPVLLFHRESNSKCIMNILQKTYSKFCSFEDTLNECLSKGNSVKKIIELSESFFAHPLCVVDTDLNYIAYNALFLERGKEIFFRKNDKKAVLYSEYDENEQSYEIFDKNKDCIIHLWNRDYRLGTFCMLCDATPFSNTELVLFHFLSEKITQALQNLSMLSGLYSNDFKHLMEGYFKTKNIDEEQLYESVENWGGKKGDTYICYKVKASDINQKVNAEYLCSIFENVLFATIAFWHDTVLVILVNIDQNNCSESAIHSKIESLVKQLRLKAGVSLPFKDLTKTWYYYRQACCAFEEGSADGAEKNLLFFKEYVTKYMIHHCVGEFPKAFLVDPGMENNRT